MYQRSERIQAEIQHFGEVDEMIRTYFPDREAIKKFYDSQPEGYFESSQNGHVFQPKLAVERILGEFAKDGKQKDVYSIVKEGAALIRDGDKMRQEARR